MGIKRCPSFSKRPGFPCGLRVLLLDASEAQRQDCEQRLKECAYEVGDVLNSSCAHMAAGHAHVGSSQPEGRSRPGAAGQPCMPTSRAWLYMPCQHAMPVSMLSHKRRTFHLARR